MDKQPAGPSDAPDALALLITVATNQDLHFRRALLRVDEVMGLGFAILAGSATLVFLHHLWILGFVLPFVFQTAVFLALNDAGEMYALAAYRDFLEDQIAAAVNQPPTSPNLRFIPWGRAAGPLRARSLAGRLLILAYLTASAGGGLASLSLAWYHERHLLWLAASCLALFIGGAIAGVYATIETLQTYRIVQETIWDELKTPPSKSPHRAPALPSAFADRIQSRMLLKLRQRVIGH